MEIYFNNDGFEFQKVHIKYNRNYVNNFVAKDRTIQSIVLRNSDINKGISFEGMPLL